MSSTFSSLMTGANHSLQSSPATAMAAGRDSFALTEYRRRAGGRCWCLSRWLFVTVAFCLCASWLTLNAASLNLAWEPSVNATGYRVYQSTDVAPFAVILTVTNTTATVPLITNTVTYYAVTAFNSAGESPPSNIITNRPTAPPPPPNTTNFIMLEAESGIVVSPMLVRNDSTASGGKFVMSTTPESGTDTFILKNLAANSYVVWCLHRSPDGMSDSFYVSMDGSGNEDRYNTAQDMQGPNWQWSRVNGINAGVDPRIFVLGAGDHTLVFRQREANCSLDKIIVTSDQSFIPPPPSTNAPPPLPPSAPLNLRVTKISSTRLQLAWDNSPANGTRLERSKAGQPYTVLSMVAPGVLQYTTSFSRKTDYLFRAQSFSSNGVSDYSLSVPFYSR